MSMKHDEMIAVIAAHRDGKIIEVRCLNFPGTGWGRYGNGERFAFDTHEYRIKPEPPKPREWILELRVAKIDGQYEGFAAVRYSATHSYQYPFPPNFVHVREVLPDEEGT